MNIKVSATFSDAVLANFDYNQDAKVASIYKTGMLSAAEVRPCQLFIRASVTVFTASLDVMEKLELFYC